MPELAEVEFYRKQWNAGLRQRVVRVALHARTRVFRATDTKALVATLPGLPYRQSWARGKQMLFRFGRTTWLGLHLGMSGKLRTQKVPYPPAKHDHLVLTTRKVALVFTDPRQFGRVRFHSGPLPPAWWTKIPPAPNEPAFKQRVVTDFLRRHPKLPIKATLLLQDGFPGIGNWMADEILWQSRIAPKRLTGALSHAERRSIWRLARSVSRVALRRIGRDFAEAPPAWLFHQRWTRHGRCPVHQNALLRATVGGRSTVWCPFCQQSP